MKKPLAPSVRLFLKELPASHGTEVEKFIVSRRMPGARFLHATRNLLVCVLLGLVLIAAYGCCNKCKPTQAKTSFISDYAN